MHSYVFEKDLILRSVLAIHFNSFELGQNLVSGQDFSEDGIFAIQMGCRRKTHEKLATVGHRSFVRHTYDAASIVS